MSRSAGPRNLAIWVAAKDMRYRDVAAQFGIGIERVRQVLALVERKMRLAHFAIDSNDLRFARLLECGAVSVDVFAVEGARGERVDHRRSRR